MRTPCQVSPPRGANTQSAGKEKADLVLDAFESTAHTGAVTLIQRFGSALNLNIHFHMLFLDGVYVGATGSSARFRRVKAPTCAELTQLTHTIAHRLARYLERQGLLERDAEHSYLALEGLDEDPMDQLRGHSITYRIAVGPQQGRKVFTLQTLPDERDADDTPTVGTVAGFSLHAGVAAKADQRDKLERLCRYVTRPAIAEQRLSLTNQGKVRYELKTPYRDGTTHVIFEPVDFSLNWPPSMTGCGRKRTLVLPDFGVSERPLWRKADIRKLAAPELPRNVRFAPGSGPWNGRVLRGR